MKHKTIFFKLIILSFAYMSPACGDQSTQSRDLNTDEPAIAADGRLGDNYIGSCQTHSKSSHDIIGCQEWQVIAERRDMYLKVIEQCESPLNEESSTSTKPVWAYLPCPRPVKRTIGGCVYPAIEQVSGKQAGELTIWQYVSPDEFSEQLVASLKEACENADDSSKFLYP